jgi:aminoglycoside phosphotransferase (APT) family kinase protein
MLIAPRFSRIAALQRPFVNREQVLADFAEELSRTGAGPRVFNVTGVGGIGKSRLLRELEDRARPAFRTAMIDLQVPALRRQDDALAVLRGQLGSQHADFDRFDIAFAVLWQRMHPHLRLSRDALPFIEYGSFLGEILDHVTAVPVFATAVGLVRLFERGTADMRRWRRIRRDPVLQGLDGLPNGELSDAVTYLFAEDLRMASARTHSVIFADSYDALVPSPAYSGRAQLADTWLRDLAGQLDRALVVIASREPLGWQACDPGWVSAITTSALGGLPMAARLELLEAGGIADPAERQRIADASAGLPFYLHLAVDTQRTSGGEHGTVCRDVVSQEEILARFLQHVAPEEVRSLELLSPARVFDYEIFRDLAAAFDLPGNRLAWDSLTGYSFVFPAGDALRLHQLIRAAILERLPAATVTQIHALLNELWDKRARQGPGTAVPGACREAAYHGLRAGTVTAAGLLGYADQAVRRGGHGSAAGIADDLEEWLASHRGSSGDAGQALRCLRAEAAVRLGDAEETAALTSSRSATAPVGTEVGARLAVAAGHGQRIAGHTRAALRIFTHVWEHAAGPPRLAAGLWAADLRMCQGRFADAEALAVELETLAPAGDSEFRGDVARLRHLTRRFAFDFAAAARYLDDATACYQAADSVLGLANACTNRAELLAITGAAGAIAEAVRAIEVQREVGAHHELGKAYTALAVAHLRRGELDQAEAALRSAFSSLDQAGYRSGRARAELYLAALHARRGRAGDARTSLCRAVAELEEADVYPALILCAARMLGVLGIASSQITSAAARAAGRIQPLGSPAELDTRIGEFVNGLLRPAPWNPDDLYRQAAVQAGPASGYYNHNIKVATATGPVLVRIPIPGADVMDLAIWPEASVMRAIRDLVTHAPRLLYASDNPPFQLLEYIDGDLLDKIAPRGVPVPAHVISDVGQAFSQLCAIPPETIPPRPADWPADGNTADFARRLSAVTEEVCERFLPEFSSLFTALGIPSGPLAHILAQWTTLHPRPFQLVHSDLHRKNMILSRGRTYFLDWELALWGDPVYDLAVHLHKMGYTPREYHTAVATWLAFVPPHASQNWEPDLDAYLAHERVKSAVVDAVRYAKIITSGQASSQHQAELLTKLAGKLQAAQATGGNWPGSKPLSPGQILTAIRDWAHRSH